MKTISGLLIFCFLLGCSQSTTPQLSQMVTSRVVYGNDNRWDTDYDGILNQNPELTSDEVKMLLEMANSTAGMVILGEDIEKNANGTFTPKKDLLTLEDSRSLCSGEKFRNQYTLPIKCSGFLVGPDLLVTAGQCLDKDDFKNTVWIFGYNKKYAFNPYPVFSSEQIYFTKEVVLHEKNWDTKKDFAVIRLNRKVIGVKYLKIRKTGKIKNGESLVIIGHPDGLTTKIAPGAKVLDASGENEIKTNLDSFLGNSGSPVINLKSGEVEGILVSGAEDYLEVETGDDYCKKVNVKSENEGEEFITKISLIAPAVL